MGILLRLSIFFLFVGGFSRCSMVADSQKGEELSLCADDPMAKPFAPGKVVLTHSWIKQREGLNTAYLHKLDPERLLHNFRINAGLPSVAKPMEGWESPGCGLRGHFVGHYLSACASVVAASGDSLLAGRLDYMIDELAVCQQKLGGGYLSAFPEADFDTLEHKYGGVWAPYYTYHKIMQGLLDAHVLAGNVKALQMVQQMATYVKQRMDKLPPEEIEKILYTPDGNPSNEVGGMNEVLQNLYRVTHDPQHLALAKLFDRQWFYQPLMDGRDILSGLHANTHLVLLNGYLRRFENTGEIEFYRASSNFWDMLMHHHAYVNGSSSGPRPIANTPTARTAEHWSHADRLSATLSGHIAESCVTHNTQKLTVNLFQFTADPQYADAYMNSFYNAVMALQNREDGRTVYHLPLGSPRQKEFLQENDYRCCNGSGIEAFTHLSNNIYFHHQHTLWVNLYVPSILKWQEMGVVLEQSSNFPQEPGSSITIREAGAAKLAVKVFIPSWADEGTAVLLNGKPLEVEIEPLSYVTIERVWNEGDRLELKFDYKFYFKTMPDNENVMALYYGPVLLAFESDREIILKGDQRSILKNLSKDLEEFTFTLVNGGRSYKLLPFYRVTGESYGVYFTLRNDY